MIENIIKECPFCKQSFAGCFNGLKIEASCKCNSSALSITNNPHNIKFSILKKDEYIIKYRYSDLDKKEQSFSICTPKKYKDIVYLMSSDGMSLEWTPLVVWDNLHENGDYVEKIKLDFFPEIVADNFDEQIETILILQ